MTIKVKPGRTTRKTLMHLGTSAKRVARGVNNALYNIGNDSVRHLRHLIQVEPATGKIYRRRGVFHQASAPGEPPASDTGFLAQTADYKVRGLSQVEFGDTAAYGVYLEDKRPHVERTANEKARDNLNTLQTSVDREIKRK